MPSTSKAQQHFMGMKYAEAKASKGGTANMNGSTMTTSQLKDFAGTKTKGLPERIKPKPKAATASKPKPTLKPPKKPKDLEKPPELEMAVKQPNPLGRY